VHHELTWCTDYYLFIKHYFPLYVSSLKCSSSGGYSCIHAAYGTVTLYESTWWPVGTQLEWELTVGWRLLVGRLTTPYQLISTPVLFPSASSEYGSIMFIRKACDHQPNNTASYHGIPQYDNQPNIHHFLTKNETSPLFFGNFRAWYLPLYLFWMIKCNWRLKVQLYNNLEAELKVTNKLIISSSSLTLEIVAETRNSVTFV